MTHRASDFPLFYQAGKTGLESVRKLISRRVRETTFPNGKEKRNLGRALQTGIGKEVKGRRKNGSFQR